MKPKFFYGWWIVIATNIICMFGFGTGLYSFGVFLKPMSEEFGWSRAMYSGAYALRSIEGGVASPVVGWAVDKYGSRWVILFGAIMVGGAFVLMPQIQSLMGFYLIYGILLSAGMSAMLYLPAWTVIAKWFRQRLSLAMAILSVGAGFGGLICAPLVALLITRYGWRTAFVIMGVFIWCVAIPLSFVVRERPEDMGLLPDGKKRDDRETAPAPAKSGVGSEISGPHIERDLQQNDYTLKEAFRSRPFWFMVLAFFFQSMAHSTVTVHTVPALTDIGIPEVQAAFSIGLLTLVSIIGRLTFGALGDYVNKRYLFMVSYVLMGSGMLVLMRAGTMGMVWVFIFLFGVGFGGNVPLMPAIRAEYFGRTALGKIQGSMTPLTILAGVIGPIFAARIHDLTGSYQWAFLVIGSLTFLAAVSMFLVGPKRASSAAGI